MAISIERKRLSLLAATALALVLATAPAGAADENGTGNDAAVEAPDASAGNTLGDSAGGEFAESDSAAQETAANDGNEDAGADDAAYDEESDGVDTAGNGADDTSVASNEEELVVTAPRPRQRGEYGAPIRTVTRTQEVSFADLDLTTDDGADALEVRIRSTARTLCRNLEIMHPVAAGDSPPCYRTAVAGAMAQAQDAIARARDE